MDNNKEFESAELTENSQEFDVMDTDKAYRKRRFKKKKHGANGFFHRIGDWWFGLSKAKKIWFSIGVGFLAVVLSLVIAVASIVIPLLMNFNHNDITSDPNELGFDEIIDEKVVNIALFGIDTRNTSSFSGNSDSIMVLSINTETKKIKIVSIMRDSLVKIEYNGKTYYQKINSAYAMGGPVLGIKTINQNFGLDIMEYATVNFYGMAEMIDAVGGIEAELTRQEVSTNSKDGFNGLVRRHCQKIGVDPEPYYIRTAGKHKLNGIQAVAYSRIRKFVNVWGTNNDFGRTDRQRYVMQQLFNKATKLPKSKYLDLIKALLPYTETSLSLKEIYNLSISVLVHSPTFEESRMPLTEYQMTAPNIPRVGSTVYYDLEFAKKVLYAFFYKDISPEEYVKENGITKNDWYGQINGLQQSGTSQGSSGGSSSTGSNSSNVSSSLSSSELPSVSSSDSSSSSPDVSQESSLPEVSNPSDGNVESGDPSGESGQSSSTETPSESTPSQEQPTTSTPQGGTTTEITGTQ